MQTAQDAGLASVLTQQPAPGTRVVSTGDDIAAQYRHRRPGRAASRRRRAGPVPGEEAAADLPLRQLARPGPVVGRAARARPGRVAARPDPARRARRASGPCSRSRRSGRAAACASPRCRRGATAAAHRQALPELGRQGRAARDPRADRAAVRARAALDQGHPRRHPPPQGTRADAGPVRRRRAWTSARTWKPTSTRGRGRTG